LPNRRKSAGDAERLWEMPKGFGRTPTGLGETPNVSEDGREVSTRPYVSQHHLGRDDTGRPN
jgi:hypothetical protein